MMSKTLPATTVRIWIGSEWAPLRSALSGFLAEVWSTSPAMVVVAAETANPESMTGRVAGWIWKDRTTEVSVIEPVSDFELQPGREQYVVGVTELLLDPDPAQVDQLYAIGIWSRFVPRKRRMLMRVTPFLDEEIVENAARAAPQLLLQIAEWSGQRILVASTDLIAAEVAGRGLRAIAQPAGDVGLNPWQSDLVRIASERGLGVVTGPQISLQVRRAGPLPPQVAAEFRRIAERVGLLVDCPVSFHG
jgi:hypothetical protein